jgi:hypothetical protein
MTSLAIVSFLAGVVVGWWFTIPTLVVAIFTASVVVAGVGAATASLWSATLDVFVVSMGLQLGYVAGSALETMRPFEVDDEHFVRADKRQMQVSSPQQLWQCGRSEAARRRAVQ